MGLEIYKLKDDYVIPGFTESMIKIGKYEGQVEVDVNVANLSEWHPARYRESMKEELKLQEGVWKKKKKMIMRYIFLPIIAGVALDYYTNPSSFNILYYGMFGWVYGLELMDLNSMRIKNKRIRSGIQKLMNLSSSYIHIKENQVLQKFHELKFDEEAMDLFDEYRDHLEEISEEKEEKNARAKSDKVPWYRRIPFRR